MTTIKAGDEGQRALAAAEAELSALADRTRAAYREWVTLSGQQDAKAAEVRELRKALREVAQ